MGLKSARLVFMRKLLLSLALALSPFILALPASAMDQTTIAIVGDTQCRPTDAPDCPHIPVADMIDSYSPFALISIGDQAQYGTLYEYQNYWAPDFGHFGLNAFPSVGNHDYVGNLASDYETFFGSRVNANGKYNYSFDIGSWHFVVFNTNCDIVGCSSSSAQLNWVRADLDANLDKCLAVIGHHPVYGASHNGTGMGTAFNAFANRGVDLYLNGHQHLYERLAKIGVGGVIDSNGVRSLNIGTGGYPIGTQPATAYTKKIIGNTKGAAFLTLDDNYYSYRFRDVNGTQLDVGNDDCNL